MKNESSQKEDPVVLKLSKWELANLHLPPVTTVTFYSGTAPIARPAWHGVRVAWLVSLGVSLALVLSPCRNSSPSRGSRVR